MALPCRRHGRRVRVLSSVASSLSSADAAPDHFASAAGRYMQAVRSDQRDRVSTRRTRLSVRPLAEELPALLAERDLSLRGLAERVGVTHSHLSRATRGANGKTVGGDLAGRIAVALGLPTDYFPEYREAVVIEQVSNDSELRDRLYRQLSQAG